MEGLCERESNGLEKIRELNRDFLASGKGSDFVRGFLQNIEKDEGLMLLYLKGRKYRPEHAWETLKRKAEVRFEYPEVFPSELPESFYESARDGSWGLLKNRDSHGRRILVYNTYKWDPKVLTLEELTIYGVECVDRLIHDPDALDNGVICMLNCGGMHMGHAKYYTLSAMLRLMHVFWQATPLKFKGLYYVNVPFYLTFLYEIIKPFMSKKLKERIRISSFRKGFENIHAIMSPDSLPEFLGGTIPDLEALEDTFLSDKVIEEELIENNK